MPILTDKEQKKAFKKTASAESDKFYPTRILKANGFARKQCPKCGLFFWSCNNDQQFCGDPGCNSGFQVVDNNPCKNRLTYIQVWKKITEMLEPRGYKPMKRYPVVSRWNPTTEFTIASIAAFQPYVISGEVPPPAKKLLIPQFCLRFGDIENVGITGSHCTGFVMIGQHQFVDPNEWNQEQCFKDIYDFLTEGVGLDKKEVTIHEDAWAGGGNFGPCMEFFSRGVELFNQVYMMFQQTPDGPKPLSLKVLDMGLGMERVAWFSQAMPNLYEATFPFVLKKLREITKQEVDFELYRRFSQYSAFLNIDEVDNLEAAWGRVAEKLNMPARTLRDKILPMTAVYSIAEHCRALLFAISDGKLPSNVGGGYNLRVIFRRAISFIDRFKWNIDMGEVCAWHAEELKEIFPEVSENLDEVKHILEVEKEKFYTTKKMAEGLVERMLKKEDITEEKLIELYDSNGIDPEIIQQAAKKYGKIIVIPDDFYGKVIARHEKKVQAHETYKTIDINTEDLPATESLYFDDYKQLENQTKVFRIKAIDYDIEVENESDEELSTKKIKAYAVIVEKSVAYPTSGGQIHDTGSINNTTIVDIIKVGKSIVHILSEAPKFKEGDVVTIKIDKERRYQLAQHHSATHIVNAAAREILGSHINQCGAKKGIDKAHLDITHFEALTEQEMDKIETRANEIVQKNYKSVNRFMSRADAEKKYGMRLYQGGAVPGTKIRVVEIPNIEVEACGGTHILNTAEVGPIKLIKSQKIQDGIVRLTFTAGTATQKILDAQEQTRTNIATILETDKKCLIARASELQEKWKALQKAKSTGKYTDDLMTLSETKPDNGNSLRELSRMFEAPIELLVSKVKKTKEEWQTLTEEIKVIASVVGEENIDKLIAGATEFNGRKLITAEYKGIDNKILNNVGKNIFKKAKDALVVLVSKIDNNFSVVVMSGPDVKDLHIGNMIKALMADLKGKGGGSADAANAFVPATNMSTNKIIDAFKAKL